MKEPLLLATRGDDPPPFVFRRGRTWPFAVRWFGITSLFGHARSLVSSAIASEQIDSRDWMAPEEPRALLRSLLEVFGAGADAPTLVEGMNKPVWIDFVADTGDDHDVSAAVGKMIFAPYRVADGDGVRELPRGDVLLFGGDTAYPVSTADEIYRRVVAPWNEILAESPPDRRRVLLGIPGNHDWYDGLDGFARLFRKRLDEADIDPRSRRPESVPAPAEGAKRGSTTAFLVRQLHLDEVSDSIGLLAGLARTIGAFVKGAPVARRKRLGLIGYEAVQDATYWTLPLAPGLDVFAVDRQLSRLDFRQRAYFRRQRKNAPAHRIVLVAPDPAIAYGEPWDPGSQMLDGVKLSLEDDELLYLTGDVHHYERAVVKRSMHVIAGGGGAFLHGTRVSPYPFGAPAAVYPSAKASRRLAFQSPVRLMLGQGGFLLHWGFVLVALVELGASLRGTAALIVASVVMSLVMTWSFYVSAGHHGSRRQPKKVAAVAFVAAALNGLLPMGLRLLLPQIIPELEEDGFVVAAYAFLGTLGFGVFLLVLSLLGLENQKAFVCLSHPGYKHFVRLCVHPDGRVEGFTIGKDDPLAETPPMVIDRFEWRASRARESLTRRSGEPHDESRR